MYFHHDYSKFRQEFTFILLILVATNMGHPSNDYDEELHE